MSQFIDGPTKTFEANGTIAQYARVKLETGGTVVVAGLAEKEIGTATVSAVDGDVIAVRLITASGTHKMIAIEALAIGAVVYTEAAGKVQDTAQATSFQVGIALEAATADGDIIEVLMRPGDTAAS